MRRLWSRAVAAGAAIPLSTRLFAILAVAVVTALALSSYAVQRTTESYLVDRLDSQLEDTVKFAVNSTNATLPLPRFALTQRTFLDHTEVNYGSPRPRLITDASTMASVAHLPVVAPQTAPQISFPLQPHTVQASDGTWWRAITFAAQTTAGDPVAVTIAMNSDGVLSTAEKLRKLSLGAGAGVAALCALLGWLAIRRAFNPLREVEVTAAAIAGGDLSQRIPERPARTEVGRLTSSLNTMLSRIEEAFRAREASEQRTRRFAADASHELRTPLASIRGFAELYRQGAVPTEEVPRTMRRIEDEAARMGGLVEDLLLLARLDEQRPVRHEPVDLLVLAADAVHDAHGLDAGRAVSLIGLNGGGPAPAPVLGDEDRLRQVVANLVGNAIRHTPAGTPIELAVGSRAEPSGPRAVLEVRDHGPGLDPESAARIFERFYRVDPSRRRDLGGGSGLGLSIVAAVVGAHHGQVAVSNTRGGGATFTVLLPQSAPLDGADDLDAADLDEDSTDDDSRSDLA